MTYSPYSPHSSFIAAREGFSDGSDSPRDFLERGIAVIDERDADVRAFVTKRLDGARADADDSNQRFADPNGKSPF
jgi:hypothetical protein